MTESSPPAQQTPAGTGGRSSTRAPTADEDVRAPLVRLAGLVDRGSLTIFHGSDAISTTVVLGLVHGVEVMAFCMDALAIDDDECLHVADAIDLAVREDRPVIGLWHSGGAELAGGIEAMDGIGRIFAATVRASGKIPQISVVLGQVAGATAYGPALTDVLIMAPAGRLFVTGPDAARSVTGEQIDMEGPGESEAHDREPGVAHIVAGSEKDAYVRTRRMASLLAMPGKADPGAAGPAEDLRALLPSSPRQPYDVRPLVTRLLDHDDDGFSFEEFQAKWAPNVVIGLGRLGGQTIGVVANNPLHKGGCLDLPSAEKAARFVRLCDCMGVPLLSLIDASGHLPGLGQEWSDVVGRGAKLLYAFVEATVPRVSVVTRHSYGSAYIAMNSRSLGATTVFAWSDAEMAVMGAEPAVGVLALGVIDEVIDPSQTRGAVAAVFAAAPFRRGAHGNIPL